MRASTIFFSAAAFAVASAQDSSSVDPFPQTTFLQQTNSLGVVTGQPAAATSQPNVPAADTKQPAVDTNVGTAVTIPAVGTGVHTLLLPGPASAVNSTQTVVVSANNSTTIVLGAPSTASASATGSGASGSGRQTGSGTPTGSGAPSASTNAAAGKYIAGSAAGFGAFLAAFL